MGTDDRVCESDPVDIATGDVVMTQIDLTLPGLPELVLERTHISSYRAGHWFGPSWSSTLDQRLEIDDESVCYFSADGMILLYPLPTGGASVLPVEGPRLPLVRTDEGYRLDDPLRQQSMFFAPTPGLRAGLLPLVAVEHDTGYRIDIDHTESGAPGMLRHSDGYLVQLHSDKGRVTGIQVLDPDGQLTVPVARFGYNDLGQLTQVTNSSGKPTTYEYDLHGRMVGWQDRNGTWYRYVYDTDGRCVRTVGAKGFFNGAFAYDRERLITNYTDSLGHTTEYHLNQANQLLREIDPLGRATRYEWDRYDRLLARMDPLGRTTSYGYDEAGRLISVTRADGSPAAVVEGDDRLSITVDDGDRVWSRTYEGDDVPDPATEQLGVAKPVGYEDLVARGTGAPESAAGGLGGTPDSRSPIEERDLFGRARSVLNRSRRRIRLGWTVEGQQNLRIRPSGAQERWRHDPEGNELEHVNGAGIATRTEYGPFNLRTATIDPAGGRTSYDYDTELRLVSVTNPQGLRWSYTYDHAGRLIEETDFDGRVLRFRYDVAGQLVWSANGIGEVTEYLHDGLGNVIERRTLAGTTRYVYDPVGRLVLATTADSELRIERDEQGRVIAESVNGRSLTFSYAADGRTMRRHTPSGVDSAWTYNAAGNPEQLTAAGHTVRFAHDAAGREISRSVDDVMVLTQSFDADDNLTAQSITAGDTSVQPRVVQQRQFDYRPDGHLAGLRDANSGPVRLVLDPAGRVTEVLAPEWRERYSYDGAGNIAEALEQFSVPRRPDPGVGPRRYAGNTLVSAGSVVYEYDRQGRMVSRREPDPVRGQRVWSYTWDTHDRLTAVTAPDGSRWAYRYDPLGRRIAKQRLVPPNGTGAPMVAEQVEFTWDGGVLVEQVHTDAFGNSRTTTWEHHPGEDRPIIQIEQAGSNQSTVDHEFFSIVTGLLGTPTELIDARGVVVWQGKSSLWGKPVPMARGAVTTPLRFPGQYADAETGLHYNVYRYYDPAIGRYLSQDPLGLGPAPNPAAYVDNPHSMSDPLGLAPKGSCGKGKGKQPARPDPHDAGNVQGSSKGKTKVANADSKKLGTWDGIEVHVDSHQGKHHPGHTIFPAELKKYDGGTGTKFPSQVNEKWHEKYFGPEVAKISKAEADKVDGNVQRLKDDAHDRRTEATKSDEIAAAKEKEAKAAQFADKQYHNESSKANAEQQAAEAKDARAKADADAKAAADAERQASDAEHKRATEAIHPKKDEQTDGVKYDISMHYDQNSRKWTSIYHCNPEADTQTWWKQDGSKIAKKNPDLAS